MDHSHAWAQRQKGAARGPQLRKSGGPELRKSGGTQLRKLGGSDQRKFCTSTRRRAIPSKLLPTWTRYLPTTSISIFPATADGRAVTPSCPAVIVTGINW